MFSLCASARLIACVLTVLCGAFLTIMGAYIGYDAYAHGDYYFGTLWSSASLAGLYCVWITMVWYRTHYYDMGFDAGLYQGWWDAGKLDKWLKDEPYQLPQPCGRCSGCIRHRQCEYPIMPDTSKSDDGPVLTKPDPNENTDTKKCLHNPDTKKCVHPPLVKLGQGSYERNYDG